jgi:thioredoxin-related protein
MKTKLFILAFATSIMACSPSGNDAKSDADTDVKSTSDESTLAVNDAKSENESILELGAKLPAADVKMKNIDGTEHDLKSLAGKNGLLVIFSCNTCPFVIGNGKKSEGWEGRYPALYDYASKAEIGMVLINPNEAKREKGDGMADMQVQHEKEGLKAPYLLDKSHIVADAFGALTTPHVFLFDGEMNLIYKGAIDDSVDSVAGVKEPYLMNAIDAHVAGKPIEPASTRQLGCSIKRVKA